MIPSPQGMETDNGDVLDAPHESIRRSEDQRLILQCLIEPPNAVEENRVQWKFSPDGKEYSKLPDGITKTGTIIQIDVVKKFHRGYYQCELNNVKFTILLRVKG